MSKHSATIAKDGNSHQLVIPAEAGIQRHMCRVVTLYFLSGLLHSAFADLGPRLSGDDKLAILCHPIYHYCGWLRR